VTEEYDAEHEPDVLFVYGTLRPGESRWSHLAPFVVDRGWVDRVDGRLYDTGRGYPAARFGGEAHDVSSPAHIVGEAMVLLGSSRLQALEVLDRVEGAVVGLYRRVVVTTHRGIRAWAYEFGAGDEGAGLDLQPIESGDWLTRW
jgi:gamma-glutamylcyclotransferase (GGCT)/AIG2-like uncharacterized protein YtfP